MKHGRLLLAISILTRLGVLLLLCFFALMTEYINFKQAYNHPRLVELSSGKAARIFYESADRLFSWFGDPMTVAQSNGGMTWSIRILGVPFTDPVAATSVLVKNRRLELGFALGLLAPLTLGLLFGRVFCSYICPASLLFFFTARLRRLLGRWLYFPELRLNHGFAWGIFAGGLGATLLLGHGIWSLILPYFAIGQTIFHGLALGTLSVAVGSVILFALLDLMLGRQFTCRYVCPTGRLLGFIGKKSKFAIRRDAPNCVTGCNSCAEVCPMSVSPRLDQTMDRSMCGECLVVCPTKCLSIGVRRPVTPLTPNFPGLGPQTTIPEEKKQASSQSRIPSQTFLLTLLLSAIVLFGSQTALVAHHFKGLPHYNYFENYPQVPEEEFLGQAGPYEVSLVVYDFQGINRDNVEEPDNVRLFLVIFNLLDNKVYRGPLTLELLDRDQVVHSERQKSAELENLYSLHRKLPDSGRYSLRLTLHGQGDLQCHIPFTLSSQKIHWGRWVAGSLLLLISVAAVGARKARINQDRQDAHRKAKEHAHA